MKYAVIQAHRGEYSLAWMCRVLQVSRSGYYDWVKRAPSERSQLTSEPQDTPMQALPMRADRLLNRKD